MVNLLTAFCQPVIIVKHYEFGGCGEAVNTADCGSVMRAFESRQPPQSGDDGNMETPGHISNPEVKHVLGDDSVSENSMLPGNAKES